MSALDEIRTGIQENIPAILGRFHTVVRDEDPWMLLPEARRTDHFGELILHVTEVALGEGRREERVRQMLHTAARHGEERLADGFPEALVFREHYLLRQALWSYVREMHDGDSPLAFEAVARIDTSLSLSTKASLRGFHRPTYEAQGRWPECIDALVSDWRTLPSVG
ncbi:MAG TPA: hypothetical protein VGR37_18295 [Longimicrobiaceae bacterium]|nr:hypothetical protein [Longimicrobiaceae bacterium]